MFVGGLRLKRFPESEYHVPFFDEIGYVRKHCPVCNEYFWTQNPDQKTCEESTPEGCGSLTFINNPLTGKEFSFREMREAFLSFFEKRGHRRVKPYPVAARWRDDLYFTHASIIDFQPYVTNGITPPPANPLVISQPCIRFVDVDNVGPTFGRHLTIFEMGGHHAFNYPDKEVYWKDQTIRYHHEFLTKTLGIKSENVTYKEDVWSGGGNAGPDLETIVGGLEIDTLVFMKYKVVEGEFIELPIRTIDTGYGIERYTWLSQGSVSCFHAIYGPLLDEVLGMAGVTDIDDDLLADVAVLSGKLTLKKMVDRGKARIGITEQLGMAIDEFDETLLPVESAFAVVDHTRCLAFMLSEGIVPSNQGEGYLTRLMIRRTYRQLRVLGIEDKLLDILDRQIDFWSQDYPHLKEMRDTMLEILAVEKDKFKSTLKRGRLLVERLTNDFKAKGLSEIPTDTLVELYDSHGLPPEVVKETAENLGFGVDVPENFYSEVAEKHAQAPPTETVEKIKGLEAQVSDLPDTRMLYYEDAYIKEFEAKVLCVLDKKYVVLDRTAFYPEGGGQPADHGYLSFGDSKVEVVDVQKLGNVIVHAVKGSAPKQDTTVKAAIDWDKRYSLMKHHTGTHVLMGAARRVLGEHVWQAGARKDVDRSRLDISHFRRLTLKEVHEIERLANEAIARNIPVETAWMPREEAEKLYGFRLYQGGVVPGREIRVVKSGDWDVEACGGTHLKNTGELGFIKILHTERIQDGVERIIFSAGLLALRAIQKNDQLLSELSEVLNAPQYKLVKAAKRFVDEWREARQERNRLIAEIARKEAAKTETAEVAETVRINGVNYMTRNFETLHLDRMIKIASELTKKDPKLVTVFYGADQKTARIVVMAGKEAVKQGINASQIAKEASTVLGGGGSGRPDFAQGGGTKTNKLPQALKKAQQTTKKQTTIKSANS
jgi:alanyl-tRNA synthetase